MSTSDERLLLAPDQAAAQWFLTELRTRISTQPLPYQYGVEARAALTNMGESIDQTRDATKTNPGCEQFAAKTTCVLNTVVRPLTAKSHRAFFIASRSRNHQADSSTIPS